MDSGRPEPDQPEIEKTDLPEPPDWEWQRPVEPKPDVHVPSNDKHAVYSRGMGLAIAIGSAFIGPVLGGILIGAFIDGKVGGTATTIGLLVGTVLAFVLLIRLVNKLNEDS